MLLSTDSVRGVGVTSILHTIGYACVVPLTNFTVPSSCSMLAICQPNTMMMPEPKPDIPMHTFATHAARQYMPRACVNAGSAVPPSSAMLWPR
jgi:hypothetical protein